MKKAVIAALLVVVILLGGYYIGSGFRTCTGVWIDHAEASEDGRKLTIFAGMTGSAGYLRDCRVRQAGDLYCLRFSMAFGGINGKIGAKNVFTVPLPEDCTELYQIINEEARLVLRKDDRGQWRPVQETGGNING